MWCHFNDFKEQSQCNRNTVRFRKKHDCSFLHWEALAPLNRRTSPWRRRSIDGACWLGPLLALNFVQWYFSMCVFKFVDGISEAYQFKAAQKPFEVWDSFPWWLWLLVVIIGIALIPLILRGLRKSPPARKWQHSRLQRLSTFPDRLKRKSQLCLSFDMGIGRLENHCTTWGWDVKCGIFWWKWSIQWADWWFCTCIPVICKSEWLRT